MATQTLPASVVACHNMNFSGNVIPPIWHKIVTFENGKADGNAIFLLSETVYWHRPVEIRDEANGHLIGLRTKFRGDRWRPTYEGLADKFGLTKRQVRDAFARLEGHGLITRHIVMETVNPGTIEQRRVSGIVEIELHADRLQAMTQIITAGAVAKTDAPSGRQNGSAPPNGTPELTERNPTDVETAPPPTLERTPPNDSASGKPKEYRKEYDLDLTRARDDPPALTAPNSEDAKLTKAVSALIEEIGIPLSEYMIGVYVAEAKQYGFEAVARGLQAAADRNKHYTVKYVQACIRNIAMEGQNGKDTNKGATTGNDAVENQTVKRANEGLDPTLFDVFNS